MNLQSVKEYTDKVIKGKQQFVEKETKEYLNTLLREHYADFTKSVSADLDHTADSDSGITVARYTIKLVHKDATPGSYIYFILNNLETTSKVVFSSVRQPETQSKERTNYYSAFPFAVADHLGEIITDKLTINL